MRHNSVLPRGILLNSVNRLENSVTVTFLDSCTEHLSEIRETKPPNGSNAFLGFCVVSQQMPDPDGPEFGFLQWQPS
jgi:hypothetical protein